jgi:hypothetical protein
VDAPLRPDLPPFIRDRQPVALGYSQNKRGPALADAALMSPEEGYGDEDGEAIGEAPVPPPVPVLVVGAGDETVGF